LELITPIKCFILKTKKKLSKTIKFIMVLSHFVNLHILQSTKMFVCEGQGLRRKVDE
jgi:hypothetical protein